MSPSSIVAIATTVPFLRQFVKGALFAGLIFWLVVIILFAATFATRSEGTRQSQRVASSSTATTQFGNFAVTAAASCSRSRNIAISSTTIHH